MSFLSLYLTLGTSLILLINSLILIINRFSFKTLPNILGYSTALMFGLSFMFLDYSSLGHSSAMISGFNLNLGTFSLVILTISLLMGFVILVLMGPSHLNESAILVAFSTLGLILMIETSHLIGFYLAIELYSLSAYILASGAGAGAPGGSINTFVEMQDPLKGVVASVASSNKEKSHIAPSVSAGLKYFLLSALSSGILIAGISIVYACTGDLTINGISRMLSMFSATENIEGGNLALDVNAYLFTILGIGLIICTLAFKIGSAPFHFWVPDVYSKVSLFVNFYLISVPKVSILFTLIKISLFFPLFKDLILVFSILSLLVGALGGLLQQKITRLLAYSSISHVGYITLGLYGCHAKAVATGLNDTLMLPGVNPVHLYSIALYLIIYSFMTLAFFSVLNVLRKVYSPITKEPYIYLTSLKNLSNLNPYLASSLAITALSMAGVPPLAGFLAKLSVYITVLDNNGIFLAIFAVICSVVTAVYYLRVIKISYFYNDKMPVIKNIEIPTFSALVISFSTLILVFFPILNPNIIYLLLTIA